MRTTTPDTPSPAALADAYRAVREATLRLCDPLSDEDCAIQSMPDASPAKWHLAHTTWFFETFLLKEAVPGYRPFHPQYEYLFNSYYNAVGTQFPRPQRGMLSRPSRDEVLDYRAYVDAHMKGFLDERPTGASAQLIELGLHHEQQHQELILTDVLHLFARNPLHPVYLEGDVRSPGEAAELRWLAFRAGMRDLGHAGTGFAFDNEGPRHRRWLDAFELASRAVTNGEYLEFMRDAGYETPSLWLSDGWAAVQARGWRAPGYWTERDGAWSAFSLRGMERVRLEEPVCHVSYYEADAFASWAGARLPTEAEWETAAEHAPRAGNFVESRRLRPAPAPAAADVSPVPVQMFGDVWEWTRSAYGPYPGYVAGAGALGEYNGKFMANQMVLRGGSCATAESHIRSTYRNFFYPGSRWQFSGVRLARDLA